MVYTVLTLKKTRLANKDIIHQCYFRIPNLTKMDYHHLISYSVAHQKLSPLLLKHLLNQKPKRNYHLSNDYKNMMEPAKKTS